MAQVVLFSLPVQVGLTLHWTQQEVTWVVAPLRILRRGEGDKHEGNVRVQSLGSGTALAICRLCLFCLL